MQIGIDEVGRGCWAGPLVAAAVVLDDKHPIGGLDDSKKLSKTQRIRLTALISDTARAIGIGWVWPADIDRHGLTSAVAAAMRQAYEAVRLQLESPEIGKSCDVVIDGNYNFLQDIAGCRTMVGADGLVPSVSAASIVAKVARDRYMAEVAAIKYPGYGFEQHVGYGTAGHIRARQKQGVTLIHRKSYKPIQAILLQSKP